MKAFIVRVRARRGEDDLLVDASREVLADALVFASGKDRVKELLREECLRVGVWLEPSSIIDLGNLPSSVVVDEFCRMTPPRTPKCVVAC